MKKVIFYISILLFFFSCQSCLKENMDDSSKCKGLDEPMPEATTTGQNVFGCKINGEDWVAYTDAFGAVTGGDKKLKIQFSEVGKHARILANKKIQLPNCDTVNQTFILQMLDVEEGSTTRFANNGTYRNWYLGRRYYVDSLGSNKVTITNLDTVNKVISGTFEVNFISDDGIDTILFNQGRFDAPYTPL